MRDKPIGKYRYTEFVNGTYRRYIGPGRRYIDGSTQRTEDIKEQADKTDEVHGSYGKLLFDSRWKEKRALILHRDNMQCIVCKGRLNLQVHHRQYHYLKQFDQFKPPWDYPNNLLVTLCEKCHKKGHNKYKVPIINL